MILDMNRGLIIFARPPIPGQVKTRLAASIGDHNAADLYTAMLADVLELTTKLERTRVMVFWAIDDSSIPTFSAPHVESFLQCGADLGERMKNAFIYAFNLGIDVCCIIGSDSPDLPPEYISRAFVTLEQDQSDIVFGPSEDGGYYLMGMRNAQPQLFEGISWSTSQVLPVSLERACVLGLRASLLPLWYDIDTIDDLSRLAHTYSSGAQHTRKAIRNSSGLSNFISEAGT